MGDVEPVIQKHECSQAVTLNTMCLQLKEIKDDMKEFKVNQSTLLDLVQKSEVQRAKYPPPEKVTDYIAEINAHKVYFILIGGGLVIVAAWGPGFIVRLLN